MTLNLPSLTKIALFFWLLTLWTVVFFSLIRHTRHQGFQGEIIVGGEFALDQANYFVKSGATAFLVDETNVETLTKKTLQDLATGYDGKAVSHLPLFS